MRIGVWLPGVVAGLATAHALFLSLFGFGYCSVEATDAAPPGPETCQVVLSWPALLITAFQGIATAGIWMARPNLAWAGVLPGLGFAILFGLSVGGALLPHVAVVALAVAVAHGLTRRRLEGAHPPS